MYPKNNINLLSKRTWVKSDSLKRSDRIDEDFCRAAIKWVQQITEKPLTKF